MGRARAVSTRTARAAVATLAAPNRVRMGIDSGDWPLWQAPIGGGSPVPTPDKIPPHQPQWNVHGRNAALYAGRLASSSAW